ncbi:MAG: hypothetical protein ABI369_15895 [Acetobacteraceae bacterium]
MERVVVGNFMNWGRLVKTWATGEDHVQDGNHYPIPGDLAEFKRQVDQADCDMTIPARITSLQVIPGTADKLVVRLPPGEMIQDSEAVIEMLVKVLRKSKYPLSDFYDMAWQGHEQTSFDKEHLLCFHDARIGEYTINNCM